MKENKNIPWNPDLKKETKKYNVSYHPLKGERVKFSFETEHKPNSPKFINLATKEAIRLGHPSGGSIGASVEVPNKDIIETKMSDMVESGTPHTDLAHEFVAGIKSKESKMKLAPLGKEFVKKCEELQKKKRSLRAGAAPKGTVVKPEKGEGMLPDLLDPVLFEKPKSSYKDFESQVDKPKEDIEKKEHSSAVKEAMKHPDKLGEGAEKRKHLSPEHKKEAVFAEYKRGTLHSGSGKKVTNPKQAVAIAISEAKKPIYKSEDIKDKLIGIADMPDKKDVQFDPKEMAMGVAVEMEHTKDRVIAEKIARDHLAEIPDYYTRLKVMEDNAKKEGMKKSAKSDAKKLKGEIMGHLQGKMSGHQINMMDITSLANHAEQLHDSGKSPENAATEAFEHFKKIGKITEANVPVKKSEDEPDEEDIFFSSTGPLGSHTSVSAGAKHIGTFHSEDEAHGAAHAWSKKNQVYPNAWNVSDHGNHHLIENFHSSVKKSLDPKDYDNAIFELKKSADDSWVSDFSKEFKTLADTYSIPFQAIAQKEGTVDCHIFKVGSCSIVHKAMGNLIDVKLHYPMDCPVEDKKLAKAMFYKLQMYYQGGVSNVERYIGPEAMGIMRKAVSDKATRMDFLPSGGESPKKRYEAYGLLEWAMDNMKIQFQRKRRPLTGIHKPKNLQARRQSRYSRRLFGAEKDKKALGKSLYTTEKGEEIFKAFGAIAKPKSSFAGVSVKMPTAGKPPSAPKPKSMSSKPKMTFTSKVTGKSPVAPKAAKVPKISSPKI